MVSQKDLKIKAAKIKLLLTDCDGVLTDAGVYYSAQGEQLKRFSLRDGMGVERLRNILNIETGIITGEDNEIIKRRAEKLKINMLYCGIKNKLEVIDKICENLNIIYENIAYIGDDVNDLPAIKKLGLTASPFDAMIMVREQVHYISPYPGGHGAFRDFAELIINLKTNEEFLYE